MTSSFVVAQVFISFLALVFVWAYLMGRAGKDDFRSDIRRIRDDLFDYMIANHENFNAQSYVQIRQMLNGILRMSNSLNIFTFFLLVRFHVKLTKAGVVLPDPLKSDGSKPLKARLRKTRDEAIKRLLSFVFLEGFTGVCVFSLLAFASLARNVFQLRQRLAIWAKRKAASYVAEATRCGAASGIYTTMCTG